MSDTGNDIPGILEQAAKDKAEKHAADEARIALEQQALRDAEVKALFEQGQQPKAPKPDPAIIDYVMRKWHQMLDPMRTACFRCGAESPVIFLTMGGVTTFGGPVNKGRGEFDNTAEVKAKLAEHGWRFELRRSYCPTCKDLGSSA